MNILKLINSANLSYCIKLQQFKFSSFSVRSVQNYCCRKKLRNVDNRINSRHFILSGICFEDRIIKSPSFAESVSEGDMKWSKSVGDSVNVDDVIGEIETDKTAMPVHATCSGKIVELLVEDGGKVVANMDLVKISVGAVEIPAKEEKKVEKEVDVTTEKISETVVSALKTNAAPAETVRLIKEVVPPSTSSLRVAVASEKAGIDFIEGSRGEQRIKMNRLRQRVAQRLKDAQNTCAMLTTFNECDMSAIIEMRNRYKDAFAKKHGVKLGFMSAFLKAAVVALNDQPVVNAAIDGTDIIYRDYIDISVAVSTPKGLVVPVLRDVHRMNFADIEKGIFDLGEKARLGRLAIEDMDGGTFTISNGGVFGSLMGTPIINPPQSAILGIHATQQRPVAVNGKVEIRPMMYLALTYDHRLIDGREAVTFLRKIKSFIEDPVVVLLDL